MSGVIQAALIDNADPFVPAISKPEAQKWDAYQTHDLYCEDIIYRNMTIDDRIIVAPRAIKFRSFLAVDKCSAYGIYDPITFNFEEIALLYP